MGYLNKNADYRDDAVNTAKSLASEASDLLKYIEDVVDKSTAFEEELKESQKENADLQATIDYQTDEIISLRKELRIALKELDDYRNEADLRGIVVGKSTGIIE